VSSDPSGGRVVRRKCRVPIPRKKRRPRRNSEWVLRKKHILPVLEDSDVGDDCQCPSVYSLVILLDPSPGRLS
jgi:hypothetical protein